MPTFTKKPNGFSAPFTEVRRFREFRAKETISRWSESVVRDRLFWLFFSLWVIPLLISAILALLRLNELPLQIPLFYSRPWGEEQLTQRGYIFIPIAGTLGIGLFNFGMGAIFQSRNKVISYLLFGTAALASVLSIITVVNIIFLFR